jgi:hypothetical protein
MKCVGKKSLKCKCCCEWKYHAPFYEWYSMVTKEFIGTICHKCAIRELFGTNFKANKRYHRWLEKVKKLW